MMFIFNLLLTCVMSSLADDTLNVCTLNVNGLLDYNCQYALKSFTFQHKIDVLFLQETHVSNSKVVKNLDSYFNHYRCFWNFGSNFSRGTAILISHSVDFSVIKYHRDLDGRFQYIDVKINNVNYRLLNVYAPNDESERREFFNDIYPYVLTNNCKIFSGDFNCIMNSNLDKKGGNINTGLIGSTEISDIVTDFELFDVYRSLYPKTKCYTWRNKTISCRLDRIYLSSCLKSQVKKCYNLPFSHSDHDCVFVSFVNNVEINKGSGYWKLNTSILNDRSFCISFREWFVNLIDGLDICIDVWDHLKDRIKEFCIDYCKRKTKVKFNVIRQLEKQYFDLCYKERKFPGNYFEQIRELKSQIKDYYLKDFKGSQIRSKAKLLDCSETCSKYFFQTEVKKGKKKNIFEIRKDNVIYNKTCDIIKQFEDFYTDLFTEENIDEDVMNYFLQDLPVLDDIDQSICEEPICIDEIVQSIKNMENNKSPGPDGLPKELYFTFIDIFAPLLLQLYNSSFEENSLSDSQKVSYITLICKDPSQSYDVKKYRPISLMNVDVKILSKLLCSRITLVSDKIVGIDQACAIRGRYILDNAHLHRNIIDYVNQKNINCSFISLDQQNAFDRVNHKFLFKVLEKFNFGPNLLKWIKILYTDLSSSVIVNSFISNPVNVTRSVKQGCSLSPILYVLCLEPFIRKVCLDNEIKGLNLPGSNLECKISAFADDSTGVLTDDKSIEKFLYLMKLYGKGSGSKLNVDKTKGMWLGGWKNRKENFKFGINFVDKLKIVGFVIGNNVTQDDVWNRIYIKFEKVLNSWKTRKLSLLEKSLVINNLACSKLWYVGSCLYMSKFYVKKFQKCVFKFLWNSKVEPLARNTVYLCKQSGGLNIVNIDLKLKALRLKHVSDIINNRDVKFMKLSIYWIGFTLRFYNREFASLNIPHSDIVSPFYLRCIDDYHYFKNTCVDSDLKGTTTKVIYSLLLDSQDYVPKIVEKNPTVEFKFVFRNVFDKFIDRFSRDVMFKIVHNILPTNSLMYSFNVYKSNKCTFCASCPETIRHLFFECREVTPLLLLVKNWIFSISTGLISLSFEHLLFQNINVNSKVVKSLILLLIGLYCKSVWLKRNEKKFDRKHVLSNDIFMFFLYQIRLRILADFERFSEVKFSEFWCENGMFCRIEDETLVITFM